MRVACVVAVAVFGTTMAVPALAQSVVLKKGTDVHLLFDSPLNSKTASIGDKVWFHVSDPVQVDGATVIPSGEKVYGTVEGIQKRGRFGMNARVQLHMASIRSESGQMVPIEAKSKGQIVSSRTGESAGALAGGGLLFGPVGLLAGAAGGYFIVGKTVNAHPGDKMTVVVAQDTPLRAR
jgi:hypothetical protein